MVSENPLKAMESAFETIEELNQSGAEASTKTSSGSGGSIVLSIVLQANSVKMKKMESGKERNFIKTLVMLKQLKMAVRTIF